jgi:predicted anti-sigma-YlaC factor YlaD
MSLIRSYRVLLSLRCREASALIAESADREFTRLERWALRLHLADCPSCRRFRSQLTFLGRMWKGMKRRLVAGEVPPEDRLSDAARKRLGQMHARF